MTALTKREAALLRALEEHAGEKAGDWDKKWQAAYAQKELVDQETLQLRMRGIDVAAALLAATELNDPAGQSLSVAMERQFGLELLVMKAHAAMVEAYESYWLVRGILEPKKAKV